MLKGFQNIYLSSTYRVLNRSKNIKAKKKNNTNERFNVMNKVNI